MLGHMEGSENSPIKLALLIRATWGMGEIGGEVDVVVNIYIYLILYIHIISYRITCHSPIT